MTSRALFGVVYLVTNTVTGKVYVGQTTQTLKRRWRGHIADARTRLKPPPLHLAILKYGENSFSIQCLEECGNRQALDEAERKWVNIYNSSDSNQGYNCTKGGDRNFDFTSDTKGKISVSLRRFYTDPTRRQQNSEAMRKKWEDPVYRSNQISKIRQMMQDPLRREQAVVSSTKYMQDHPEARNLLRDRNKTVEGRKVLSDARHRYLSTPGALERMSQITKKAMLDPTRRALALQSLSKARAVRMKTWLVEEDLRPLLQGITARQYAKLRRTRKDLPGTEYFPKIYGKTFATIRDEAP